MTDHRTSEKLRHCWGRFRSEWDEVRGRWHDAVADRFEREFVLPWEEDVTRVLAEVTALEEALGRAELSTTPPSHSPP